VRTHDRSRTAHRLPRRPQCGGDDRGQRGRDGARLDDGEQHGGEGHGGQRSLQMPTPPSPSRGRRRCVIVGVGLGPYGRHGTDDALGSEAHIAFPYHHRPQTLQSISGAAECRPRVGAAAHPGGSKRAPLELMPIRIATYARVSTADQADTGTSLADQERRLKAAVVARDATLVHHFVDAGVSGAADSRPGLDSLRRAAHEGSVDMVMATKIDRVSRSAVGLLALIEDLRKHGCHLVLIDEGLDTSTSAGDLTSGLLGVIGGWERKRIAERTKAGRRAAAELEGRFVGSTPPFGYRSVPPPGGKGKRLVVDQGQAETIKTMFQLVVVENRPITEAAELMNRAGLTAPTGGEWTQVSLGRWALREGPVRTASGVWRFDNIDVSVPPILKPAEAALWAYWQDSRRRRENRQRGPYLLSGMVHMPCGRYAMGRTAGKQRPTYCCRQHYLPAGDPGRHPECLNISCASLDGAIVHHVRDVLSHPQTLRDTAMAGLGLADKDASSDELLGQLRSLDRQVAEEAKLFRSQGYSGSPLLAVLAPLQQERERLTRQIALTQQAREGARTFGTGIGALADLIRESLDSAGPQVWRRLLIALEVTVRIDGYDRCQQCTGSGYLAVAASGGGRRWPKNCRTCLRGSVPQLTVELDDVAALALTEKLGARGV